MANGDQRGILWDFVTLGVEGITCSIVQSTVEAHNFELKLGLISTVQQSQFGRAPMEGLNLQLSAFLVVCGTLKLSRVSTNRFSFTYFPFN